MKSLPILVLIMIALLGCETTTTSAPQHDIRPASWSRPDRLVPGEIPRRVRYHYAKDADVVEKATTLENGLKSGSLAFTGMVFINSGAWHWLRGYEDLGKKDAIPLTNAIPTDTGVIELEGRILRDPAELKNVVEHIRDLLQSDGGFSVRALRSDEMDFWWTFIGFDIVEPTFVVESSGSKFRFIFALSSDGIQQIDELSGLYGGT